MKKFNFLSVFISLLIYSSNFIYSAGEQPNVKLRNDSTSDIYFFIGTKDSLSTLSSRFVFPLIQEYSVYIPAEYFPIYILFSPKRPEVGDNVRVFMVNPAVKQNIFLSASRQGISSQKKFGLFSYLKPTQIQELSSIQYRSNYKYTEDYWKKEKAKEGEKEQLIMRKPKLGSRPWYQLLGFSNEPTPVQLFGFGEVNEDFKNLAINDLEQTAQDFNHKLRVFFNDWNNVTAFKAEKYQLTNNEVRAVLTKILQYGQELRKILNAEGLQEPQYQVIMFDIVQILLKYKTAIEKL